MPTTLPAQPWPAFNGTRRQQPKIVDIDLKGHSDLKGDTDLKGDADLRDLWVVLAFAVSPLLVFLLLCFLAGPERMSQNGLTGEIMLAAD